MLSSFNTHRLLFVSFNFPQQTGNKFGLGVDSDLVRTFVWDFNLAQKTFLNFLERLQKPIHLIQLAQVEI